MNHIIFDALFVNAFLYDPGMFNAKDAMKCFVISIAELLPNNSLISYIKNNPIPLGSKNEFFYWVYECFCYFKSKKPNDQEYKNIYNEFSNAPKDKTFWSHPDWAIIHHLAFINEGRWTSDKIKAYKAMMSCFQYIIPCSICRGHLEQNLNKHHIDDYGKNLFEWSVNLHNTVNLFTGKRIVSMKEAIGLTKAMENK